MTVRSRIRTTRARSGADSEWIVPDGETIFAEGEPGRQMFIVASGRVRVAAARGGGEVTLGFIERGDFFGEMALLEGMPRSANAYAVGETRLVVIEPGALLLRIRRDPTLAIEMLHQLSGRLRRSNASHVAALGDAPGDDLATTEVWEIEADEQPGPDAH